MFLIGLLAKQEEFYGRYCKREFWVSVKLAALGGNFKMNSGLTRGTLKRSHGNPELNSEKSDKCVETIYLLPVKGNEIVHSFWKQRGKV